MAYSTTGIPDANASSGSDPATHRRELRTPSLTALRSTRVVTPKGVRSATVLIEGGRIVRLADWDDLPAGVTLHDLGDLVLLPGLVDSHVHINDAGDTSMDGEPIKAGRSSWEGFATATQAAASGGITTLVDMPLNCVPETNSVAALEAKRAAAHAHVWVDWASWGGLVGNSGNGGNEDQLRGLVEAGVPGFKCFLINSGIDSFAWVDEAQIRKGLKDLRGSGLPLLAHAEVAAPVDRATAALNASEGVDWQRYATYLASRPAEAELEAIELLLGMAAEFEARIHIVHLATPKALPMLKKAKQMGFKVSVETCPHYLWFSAETIPDGATEYKCAPPIRSAADRDALWHGLLDGTIDMVASDHSPCPPELKAQTAGRFDQAWGGIASLGLALPVLWTGVRQYMRDGDALLRIAGWLSTGPAQLAGMAKRKGALAAGFDADLAVFDPDATWTVSEADLHFRHKLSPYLGAQLRGRVMETWLRGQRIFSRNDSAGTFAPNALGQEVPRGL